MQDADRVVMAAEREKARAANLAAFLVMIRACEGTTGEDGYRALFGYLPQNHGPCFDNFDDHPNVRFSFRQTDGTIGYTTAAGAYQIIYPTWVSLRSRLRLADFSPTSQDRAATELILERNALEDVYAGYLDDALAKCWPVWASLPGSTYSQPRRSASFALAAFVEAGGAIA